ncbi:SMI1/KNR4 family protein [Catenovulum sp. SM1970]|uniref:SMI1/KNR4 family protein n=1 Tax=Marinifaba aquimaris TaxID=2741323 RepID=UPI001571BF4C|nr:SMI1/KNR4 family protein [Marinifaba aquimaris]NTS77888.1 SMI1/KNR4 family protein [Marinifaba aquimaris]
MSTKIDSAIRMMEQSGEEILVHGGASEELILAAESRLGIKFPQDYRYFLRKYGALCFESEEFYGLTKYGLQSKSIPCAIFATESAIKLGDISNKMIKVKSTGYGPIFCIDLTGEYENSPVVETELSFKREDRKHLVAQCFADFFYKEIERAIKEL